MEKIIQQYVPEKCEHYSDLSGAKINLKINNEELDCPSSIKLFIPTQFWEDHSWSEGKEDWRQVKDCEKIELELTTKESIAIYKYLKKKWPKSKALKIHGFLNEKS